MLRFSTFAAVLVAVGLSSVPGHAQEAFDPERLGALEARSIGPAGMSGRVAAIEVLTEDPRVMYVGAATGGLWKTEDEGLTWRTLFDDQDVASIGAVAVHPRARDTVWIGTGEGNPRNSSSVGRGVYRSLDGGETWTHLGLEHTEKIPRIHLHPDDPQVAWVAALGTTWGENEERGVFKTTDGGASFEKVLYVDEKTGCADLTIDPRNPDKLIAAMWDYRRTPDFMRSGGPGSALYISVDGGASWRQLSSKDGLPKGELGRIGVAFAPSNPSIVYALVEAEESALCRSDDGGFTWKKVNTDIDVSPRPFYFADIRVDTKDPDRIYRLASVVSVSNDGGKSFEILMPWSLVHPDHHELWIHPEDPTWIVNGNDGGVAISKNHGKTWRFVTNLPLAQFYHVAVDDAVPFNVYGGLQDNGSWRGPSDVWENGGIRNHHWDEVAFGDGFATLPIPGESDMGYAMSQGGSLMRWNAVTGERRSIRPPEPVGDDEPELRFNWNAGIAIDPFDPNTVYYGSQYLHRSRDRGDTWETVSPDLTTNNPEWQRQSDSGGLTPDVTAAENYTTILTIAPSTLEEGVIWVGTDDGRVQLSRDGGETWQSVEENILEAPRNTWVPHIEASKFDPASAFVVLDDHRRSNWAPYVFQTMDYGATWTSITTDEVDGYVHAIEQDPVDKDLLFLGTEFGLWVSTNGGSTWFKWKHGIPTVAVRALVVHPRDHDLVVATHGRAAYVIDDIRPLRELDAETCAQPVHLFEVPPAIHHRTKQTGGSRFPASSEFRGETRRRGAMISFWLDVKGAQANAKEASDAEGGTDAEGVAKTDEADPPTLTVEILDAEGTLMRTLEPKPKHGLNRIRWGFERKGFRSPFSRADSDGEPAGPPVLPGTYTIHVHYGDDVSTGEVVVMADPRSDIPDEARAANYELRMRHGELGERLAEAVYRIDHVRGDIGRVRELVKRENARIGRSTAAGEKADDPYEALMEAAKELEEELDTLHERLRGPEEVKGIADTESLTGDWGGLRWGLSSSFDTPSPALGPHFDKVEADIAAFADDLNAVLTEKVPAFAEQVEAAGLTLFSGIEPL